MSDSNNSFPDDFPDMTLPERADQSAAPSRPAACRSQTRWRVGDRVLAPWEPHFLYVGRVAQIQEAKALIEFEDGDTGRVPLDQLRPLAVERGQKVFSRRKMGPHFFPGEIGEVRGDEVCVVFADGQDEEWTRIASLRIPCQVLGPGAEPMRVASHQASLKNLEPGDRVWAPWDCRLLYAGTVEQLQDTEVHVHFDDGKSGWVQLIQVMPLEIPVGLRVLGWKSPTPQHILDLDEKGKFCPGVVTKVNGDSIFIVFQDGDQAWMTTAALALPCQPLGPDARATKVVGRQDSRIGIWLATIALGILLALLRAGCRAG